MDPVISFSALRELLRDAVKAVPAVRYALGVAGIGAAAAIVFAIFQQKAEVAVLGTAIMIGFMVVLVVFATLSRLNVAIIQYPAILLLWVTIVCFCATIALLTSSFFFKWPVGIRDLGSNRADTINWMSIPGPPRNDALTKLASTNLPAAEEITALLSQTKPKTLLRIAVPNIAVQPADQQPAANAIKERIALHLKAQSIVVPEAEIVAMNTVIGSKGIDMVDQRELIDAANNAAADVVLVMKMFQIGSSQYTFSVTPIVVGEQKALDTIILEKGSIDIARSDEPVAKLVDQIMKATKAIAPKGDNAIQPRTSLSIIQLDQLSRARALLQQGRLIEAQPIFAQALGEPSTAWQSEADYAALMNNLGMSDWVEARMTEVLKRVPSNSWCDRAALMIQKARAFSISASSVRKPFAIAREMVSSATACGDIPTIALALHQYAYFALETDVPLTLEANHRARALLDKNAIGYEWLRCQLDMLDVYVTDEESRQRANISADYAMVAEKCEKVGNLRTAAIAYRDAANTAWHPDQSLELLARSIAAATPVGGVTLDDGLFRQASSLRDAGRKSDADLAILHVIQSRIADLAVLHGDLPNPLDEIDSELLSRLTLNIGASRELSANEKLLSEVHRGVLAKALRVWAKRTEVDSRRLAISYRSVADKLSADGNQANDVDAIEQRIIRTGLAFEDLSNLTSAPLRSDGINLKSACSALWDLFFALRKRKDVSDELLNKTVATAKNVSNWRGSSNDRIQSLQLAAYFSRYQSRSGDALEAIEKAKLLARNDSSYTQTLLTFEAGIVEHSSPDRNLQILDRIVEVSESVSPRDWIAATYNAAIAKWKAGKLTPEDGGRQIENLAENLLSKHVWDAADTALVKAAQFYNEAKIAVGTPEAVAAQGQRLKFENVRATTTSRADALRFLAIAADVAAAYGSMFQERNRGGATDAFRSSPPVKSVMIIIDRYLDQLVAESKYMDAVRVVGKLPYFSPGQEERVSHALDWAKHLEESSDYSVLVATLYDARATIREEARVDGYIDDLMAARQHYLAAKTTDDLGPIDSKLIRYSFPDEAKVWHFVDDCMSALRDDANQRTFCHTGFSSGVHDWPRAISDRVKTKLILADGLRAIANGVDIAWPPISRYDYRSGLSWLALLAIDLDAFNKLNDEIRHYYTVEKPTPYQWATHLARAGSVAETVDPKLAVKLYLEFDRAGGTREYWIADAYVKYAAAAQKAGDTESEQLFLTKGRSAALRADRAREYRYDLYGLNREVVAQNWSGATEHYSAAIATLQKVSPDSRMFINELRISLAVTEALNGDITTADREFSRQAKWAAQGMDEDGQSPLPCFSARVLELGGAIKFAMNSCAAGRALRDQAATVRLQCRSRQCYRDGNSTWCDGPSDDAQLAATCQQPFAGDPKVVLEYWQD